MKEDPEFVTVSRSELCKMVRELRAAAERERQRATSLERALELERQASRRAWQLAVSGA